MAKKILAILFLSVVIHLSLFSPNATAKDKAEIGGIAIQQQRGNLEVSFQVNHCFTPSLEEAVLSGVTTTFRILLVLQKSGYAFIQPSVVEIILEHSIKYDVLKREFRIQLPEHPDKLCYTYDFNEAKRLMSTVSTLPLMPLNRLEKNREYRLNIKAELSKFRLPLFVRYIFFFVSLWDFETDWRQTSFFLHD